MVTADEGVTDGMLGSPEGAVAYTPDQERTPGGEPGGEPSMEASLTSPETAKKKAKGHPPGGQAFEKRIMEAISALGEKTGSSTTAIAKHMDCDVQKKLSKTIKIMLEKDMLIKVKASYKVNPKFVKKQEAEKAKVKKLMEKKAQAAAQPKTAYGFYLEEFKTKHLAENPEAKAKDVEKLASAQWKELDTQQRAPYVARLQELKREQSKQAVINQGLAAEQARSGTFASIREWLEHRRKFSETVVLGEKTNAAIDEDDPQAVEKRARQLEREEKRRLAQEEREREKEKKRLEKELSEKYPMEDADLAALGEQLEEPPCGEALQLKLGFPTECFPDLLMVHAMLENFSEAMEVPEIPLSELRDMMISGIGQGTKPLMDAYLRLTRLVVENSSIASYCGCEGSVLPLRKLVSQYNWTEVLRLHLESDGAPSGKDIKRVREILRRHDYYQMTLQERLTVLTLLANLTLDTAMLRERMRNLETRAEELKSEGYQLHQKRRNLRLDAQVKWQPGFVDPRSKGKKGQKRKKDALEEPKPEAIPGPDGQPDATAKSPQKEEEPAVGTMEENEEKEQLEDEDEEEEGQWRREGHEWLLARVRRVFGKGKNRTEHFGFVAKWRPAGEAEDEPALWRVVHDDGDKAAEMTCTREATSPNPNPNSQEDLA